MILANTREAEETTEKWFAAESQKDAISKFVKLYWHLGNNTGLDSGDVPAAAEVLKGKVLEAALLRRDGNSPAKYQPLTDDETLRGK